MNDDATTGHIASFHTRSLTDFEVAGCKLVFNGENP